MDAFGAFLGRLPIEAPAAAQLASSLQTRFDARTAGALLASSRALSSCRLSRFRLTVCPAEESAPPDSALRSRIDALEGKLMSLSAELHQRRQTIPAFIAQRTEEQNRSVVSSTRAAADAAEEGGDAQAEGAKEAVTTALALTSDQLQRASAVCSNTDEADAKVKRALEQASEMTAQLARIEATLKGDASTVSETDKVIAIDEKENGVAAAMLRRRRDANQAQELEPPTKLLKM